MKLLPRRTKPKPVVAIVINVPEQCAHEVGRSAAAEIRWALSR